MVALFGAQADAGAVLEPRMSPFELFAGHPQPLASPNPLDTLVVHKPARLAQQGCTLAVTVAAILEGQFDEVGGLPLPP